MLIMFIKDVVNGKNVRYVHGRPWIMDTVFAAINYTFLRLQATSRVSFRRVEVTRGLGADGHEVRPQLRTGSTASGLRRRTFLEGDRCIPGDHIRVSVRGYEHQPSPEPPSLAQVSDVRF